jgi:starch phosphorylase
VELRSRLDDLAHNLYWTWNSDVYHIFQDLDAELWRELKRNPVAFLERLPDDTLEDRARFMAARITRAHYTLRDYLESESTWGRRHARSLRLRPVAYFSAEFAVHESLPVYSGGLGVLSGDHLKAASDLDVPLVGVGLLYQQGYFSQSLDKDGWQQEAYHEADVDRLPLVAALRPDGEPVRLALSTRHGPPIHVRVWTAAVGRCRLVLLDSNVDENTEETRRLTAQLYGGDDRTRILQELVLGVGGMRALSEMGVRLGVLHLNEGHSAFAPLELARQLIERDGRDFNGARDIASAMSVFTTHTPVAAGHDRFAPELVEEAVGPLRDGLRLSSEEFLALGRANPGDAGETFCMTVLGLKMSRYRNAVSNLHRRVTRTMWRPMWPGRSLEEIPIAHVTNGVHVGTWVAAEMDRLYRRWLGEDWQEQMHDPEIWEAVEDINDEEIWELSGILRQRLVEFVRQRVRRQCTARGEPDPGRDPAQPPLSETALTIGVARRFARYKRADLLLRDPDRLDQLINHPERPVQILFAGKAHPRDDEGKKLIQKIFHASRESRFARSVVFVEDYDINVARRLTQGVDVWLNIPRRPMEACGTSGMKAVLNGALNLSVLDGWWAEAYDGSNGFAVGDGREHVDWEQQDQTDLGALFEVLENEVVPMFYERDEDDLPREWIQRQKNALRALAWRFSSHRMVVEYASSCYLPAAGATTSSFNSIRNDTV